MRPSSGRLPITNKVDDNSKSVGILYTGYLEKRNPVSGGYKKRFVVLTHEAIHWFDRQEDEDLFGEERGRIKLNVVISVRVLDEDGNSFQIGSIDKSKRIFRSTSPTTCEEWVSALKSTIKNLGEYTKKKAALHAQHQNDNHFSRYNNSYDNNEEDDATPDVNVLLVSHVTTYSPYTNTAAIISSNTTTALSNNTNINTTEIVLARNPEWDRLIFLPNFQPNDKLLISLSNGGLVTLSYHMIEVYSEGGVDFEVAVQNVTLASSLRMTVQNINNINQDSKASSSNLKKSGIANNSISNSNNNKPSWIMSFFSRISQHVLALCCNRATLISLILSIMVLFVSALSFRYFQPNISSFVLFSIVNALYVIKMLSSQNRMTGGSAGKQVGGGAYNIRIHAHSFTSPDAPINTPEDDIPKRFIDGCEGDMKEARRRWDITRHWRETERLDEILTEPQPHFFTIKAMLPHYHYGRDRTGHVVYYERPGLAKLDEMKARGIGPDEMYRHWLFFVEYQYRILLNDDEAAKTVAVLDMDLVNMSFMSGDTFVHLKRTIAAANAHYPERSHVIYVVNAPYIASMLWGMVKGMVHPNTQKKVRILTKAQTLKGLQEHIAIEDIPEYYGGQAKCTPPPVDESDSSNSSTPPAAVEDSCRYYGPDTVAINAYVRKINEQNAAANQDPFDVISDKRASISAAAVAASAAAASTSSSNGSTNGATATNNAKNPPGQQGVLNALKESAATHSSNDSNNSGNGNGNNQQPHNTVTGAAIYTNQYPSFGNNQPSSQSSSATTSSQQQQQQRLPPVSESNKKDTTNPTSISNNNNTPNKSTYTNRLFAFNKAVRQQDTWSVNSDTFSTP